MNLAASLGGFGQGFVDTYEKMGRLKILRDTLLQREEHQREELKLEKQKLEGLSAWRQLQERKFVSDLEQEQQQRQQRQAAGSALGLLQAAPAGLGFALDSQSQADLHGMVTQQEAREGRIGDGAKQFQALLQRRAIIDDMDLTGLPEAQQPFARAGVAAFKSGAMSGDALFNFLGRLGTAPGGRRGSRFDLAMQAAQGSAEAQRALELMSPGERSMTSAELSWRAAGGETRAQQALERLQGLRTPPRSGRRKDRTMPEPGPADHPSTFRGGAMQGKGRSAPVDDDDELPVVRGFRRVR